MKKNNFNRSYRKYQLKGVLSFLLILIGSAFLSSCGTDDDTIVPKPHAYFRLNFPEKKYVKYDSIFPFTFDIPLYSNMEIRKSPDAKTSWLNLNFPTLNGTINMTYKSLDGDLDNNLQETYDYVNKHQVKASSIEDKLVSRDSVKVYGLIYEIGGNAASSIQFFLTDSTKNFIRGALYFNAVPNTDSISPVIDYIRKDIYRMINTFEWKKQTESSGSLPHAMNKKQGRSK